MQENPDTPERRRRRPHQPRAEDRPPIPDETRTRVQEIKTTIRLTKPLIAVVDVLTEATVHPDDPVWGLRICERTDLGPGTVYPILERLAELGWIESEWEAEQPSGRPKRRFYRMTGAGRAGYAEAVAARNSRRRWGLTPRPAPGGAV